MSASNEEYDRELATRRDFEEEVKRLRVLVADQNTKLAALAADQRRRELLERTSKELSADVQGLEQNVSKLKAERDMILAEVEELSASKRLDDPVFIVPVLISFRSLQPRSVHQCAADVAFSCHAQQVPHVTI